MNGHTDRDCGPICDGLDADGYGCLCDCHDGGGPEHCCCYDPRSMEYGPVPCPVCARQAVQAHSTASEIGRYLAEQLPKIEGRTHA